MGEMKEAAILIVEDEKVIALSTRMVLERKGYRVIDMVESGEEAIETVKREKPDLVIMDIQLAGKLNGIETTHILNEHDDIPVVYASAYSDREILEKAKITSPYSFIVKPIKERELEIVIEIALERARMQKQQQELIAELREALHKVKTLKGLLPICANCKKIRDDEGYWHQVEEYIQNHSDADFTHGICPDCAKILYPDIFKEDGTEED